MSHKHPASKHHHDAAEHHEKAAHHHHAAEASKAHAHEHGGHN